MRVEKYYYSDANKPESDIQNTEKFQSFTQLSVSCQSLAREIGANLFMDTDDHAGWITFICDVLSFKDAAKQTVQQLADVADEVTIRDLSQRERQVWIARKTKIPPEHFPEGFAVLCEIT